MAATYLPVLTNGGTTVNVAISGGFLSVFTYAGTTVNVPVY
jgi:hypothetical protein